MAEIWSLDLDHKDLEPAEWRFSDLARLTCANRFSSMLEVLAIRTRELLLSKETHQAQADMHRTIQGTFWEQCRTG